jgi:chromosome segregation ATPase
MTDEPNTQETAAADAPAVETPPPPADLGLLAEGLRNELETAQERNSLLADQLRQQTEEGLRLNRELAEAKSRIQTLEDEARAARAQRYSLTLTKTAILEAIPKAAGTEVAVVQLAPGVTLPWLMGKYADNRLKATWLP